MAKNKKLSKEEIFINILLAPLIILLVVVLSPFYAASWIHKKRNEALTRKKFNNNLALPVCWTNSKCKPHKPCWECMRLLQRTVEPDQIQENVCWNAGGWDPTILCKKCSQTAPQTSSRIPFFPKPWKLRFSTIPKIASCHTPGMQA